MSTAESPAQQRATRRFGLRAVAAGLCFALAFLLLPISIVGYWGQRTLTDTEAFVETVGPLAAAPEIQEAVAKQVSTSLASAIDVDAFVTANFGAKADAVAAPIGAAIETFVEKATLKVMESPRFEKFWIETATRLQQATIAALEGETDGPVQASDGQIVLDVSTVVSEVRNELVARGLSVAKDIPDPPAADTQIVLLDSAQVSEIQTVYKFSVPLAQWLIVIAVLLFAGGVALSRRRSRMVMLVGGAFIISGALLSVGLSAGSSELATSLSGTEFALAAAVFYTQFTNALASAATWTIILGIALALGGWLAGPSKPATAIRAKVRPDSTQQASAPAAD